MIIDLHSHYLPLDAARSGSDLGIELVETGDGFYRFTAGTQSLLVNEHLLDPELQRRDLRRQRLDQRVLMVPPFCLLYELPVESGVRWARALNDGIADTVTRSDGAFCGFATVPLQHVPAAVHELGRAVRELGLQGVEIATNINGVELDARSLDPFWDTVQRHDVPILVHPHYVAGANRMGQYHLRNLVGNPAETALAAARLLFGGVLERFPHLRVVLSHGGGALPSLVGRLEHGFRVRDEARVHASAPIENVRRLFYDTVVFDPRLLRHLTEIVGLSQIVLGTDYPFDMSEADPVGFATGAGLSQDEVETLLANASRLLRASPS